MRNRLCFEFDGDESKYELFEVKFLGYLRLQKLLDELNKETPDVERNEGFCLSFQKYFAFFSFKEFLTS